MRQSTIKPLCLDHNRSRSWAAKVRKSEEFAIFAFEIVDFPLIISSFKQVISAPPLSFSSALSLAHFPSLNLYTNSYEIFFSIKCLLLAISYFTQCIFRFSSSLRCKKLPIEDDISVIFDSAHADNDCHAIGLHLIVKQV